MIDRSSTPDSHSGDVSLPCIASEDWGPQGLASQLEMEIAGQMERERERETCVVNMLGNSSVQYDTCTCTSLHISICTSTSARRADQQPGVVESVELTCRAVDVDLQQRMHHPIVRSRPCWMRRAAIPAIDVLNTSTIYSRHFLRRYFFLSTRREPRW